MLERVLIAGSGGQGVLLIGRVYASAAVTSVPYVTYYPAYGAEVRGGTSNCEVILASREIASPVAETHDTMIVMNQASVDRFLASRREDTLVLLNSALCRPEPGTVAVPATRAAMELGDIRAANFVMLGAYLAARGFVAPDRVEDAIRDAMEGRSAAMLDMNIRAFRLGLTQPAGTARGASETKS